MLSSIHFLFAFFLSFFKHIFVVVVIVAAVEIFSLSFLFVLIDQFVKDFQTLLHSLAASFVLMIVDLHNYSVSISSVVIWIGSWTLNKWFPSEILTDFYHSCGLGSAQILKRFFTILYDSLRFFAWFPVWECFACFVLICLFVCFPKNTILKMSDGIGWWLLFLLRFCWFFFSMIYLRFLKMCQDFLRFALLCLALLLLRFAFASLCFLFFSLVCLSLLCFPNSLWLLGIFWEDSSLFPLRFEGYFTAKPTENKS